MKGSKILATVVAITMIMSTMAILNVSDNTVKATRYTEGTTNTVTLSNNGSVDIWDNLTCGEYITLYVNNNSLTPSEDYAVKVWNGSTWRKCYVDTSTDNADEYGDLAIKFRVPGWDELRHNPIWDNGSMLALTDNNLTAGQWNVSLFTEDGTAYQTPMWQGLNITLNIGNLYDVYFQNGSTQFDYLTYGDAKNFNVYVRNWTGSNGWDTTFDSSDDLNSWDIIVSSPNGKRVEGSDDETVTSGNYVGVGIDLDAYTYTYEDYFYVNISSHDKPSFFSNVTLPVKPTVTCSTPSNKEWGQSLTPSGYVRDINSSGISGLTVGLYAPYDDGSTGIWTQVDTDTTSFDGAYSFNVATGPDEGWPAGTWYVGLLNAGNIDEADQAPYVANFVPYHSFTLGTEDDELVVRVQNTDEIISGFEQTINVSVDNDTFAYSGSSDGTKEFQNVKLHVTGLSGWDGTTEYDDDDIVPVTPYVQYNSADEKETYYRFNYTFNETGTATIIASWPGNMTSITKTSPKAPGEDSFYDNTYTESTAMLANITGRKNFAVTSADSMNLIIDDMVDAVSISKSGSYWKNSSDTFLLKVFGSTQADPMNATIKVSGCGLDFTISEGDPSDTDECIGYPGDGTYTAGQYNVQISPKTSGTLTITATNGTNEVSKDYAVTGITGSVTTSEGDDLKLTVGTTETITVTASSDFAEIHLSYYDSDWAQKAVINDTIGDATSGNGASGTYTFNPDSDDIDELGYIIVAAEAGSGNYMYDIIEVEPVYDLEIELVSPINTSQMFTAGLEYDVTLKLVDSDGNVVEDDDPVITVKLLDEGHDEDDPLQTWSSSDGDLSFNDPIWEFDSMFCNFDGWLLITGQNATSGIIHEGNLTVDVGHATIEYSPTSATAGIGTQDLTVSVTGTDANGDPLPEDTTLYFWCPESRDSDVTTSTNSNGVNFKNADTSIELDENGEGEFELDDVGDNKTSINATLRAFGPSTGNRTLGKFSITFPVFDINPETIYIGQSNIITIYAYKADGTTPIENINLTLFGAIAQQPDPVETNADGKAVFSLEPESSGIINVTIARNVTWVGGDLQWDNAIITDSYITIDSLSTLTISVSKSPAYQGETLTVTVKSGASPVQGIAVTFGELTGSTDSSGQVDFTVPDPGVESAIYTITAEKDGYITKEKSITVIKVYSLSATATPDPVEAGATVTINAILVGKGPAVGATVEFNGETKTTDAYGQATFTAPSPTEKKDYTATITYQDYDAYTISDITVKAAAGTPGFELLTLIAAIGVAFILLRRRRNK